MDMAVFQLSCNWANSLKTPLNLKSARVIAIFEVNACSLSLPERNVE
jgi:hypothetical protein